MTIAYFDCFSGAGGDMIVASLIDAGADCTVLRAALDSLNLSGYQLSIEKVTKQGFAATRFDVTLDDLEPQPHRHLGDVLGIIDAAPLTITAKASVRAIFTRLAQAEALVHGSTVEAVHFHEVGAVDAILDVVGAVVALEQLGVTRVVCSPIPVGSGSVTCAHGVMPVPAPATANMLKGVPLAPCDETGELTTPTAAAVLTTLADGFGPAPGMTLRHVGCGAGTRDGATRPNLLRVLIGDDPISVESDVVAVLETNLDDLSPQVVAHCMERLLAEGALDVFTVPIQMKKSRAGVLLTVLCEPNLVPRLEQVVFMETTTFGIRRRTQLRTTLARRHESVETPFGPVRMKIGTRGEIMMATPEYEDCRAAALAHDAPLCDVIAAARRAWEARGGAA